MFTPFHKFNNFANQLYSTGATDPIGQAYDDRDILVFADDTWIEIPTLSIDTNKNFRLTAIFRPDINVSNRDIFKEHIEDSFRLRIRTGKDIRVVLGGLGANTARNCWEIGGYNSVDWLSEFVQNGQTRSTVDTQISLSTDMLTSNSGIVTGFSISSVDPTEGFVGVIGNVEIHDENDTVVHRWRIDDATVLDGGTIVDDVGGVNGILHLGSGVYSHELIPNPEDITEVYNQGCEFYGLGMCTAMSKFKHTYFDDMTYAWTVSVGATINGPSDTNEIEVISINQNLETEVTVTCVRTSPTGISSTSQQVFTQYRTESATPTRTALFFNGDTYITFAYPDQVDLISSGTLIYTLRILPDAPDARYDVWGTNDNDSTCRAQDGGLRIRRGGVEYVFSGFTYGPPHLVEEKWDLDTLTLSVTITNLETMVAVTRSEVCDTPIMQSVLTFGDRGLSYSGVLGTISQFDWYNGDDVLVYSYPLDTVVADGGVIEDAVGGLDGILTLGSGYWIEEGTMAQALHDDDLMLIEHDGDTVIQ